MVGSHSALSHSTWLVAVSLSNRSWRKGFVDKAPDEVPDKDVMNN